MEKTNFPLQFQEEHQRLMRALYDSIDRESNLQRQLRRMKEELVAVALRFQVAIRLSEEDEKAVMALRKEAAEARVNELNARKQATEAIDIIQSLKIEISSLKRQVKELERNSCRPMSRGGGGGTNTNPATSTTNAASTTATATASSAMVDPFSGGAGMHAFQRADAEVEEMMNYIKPVQFLPNTGGDTKKMSSFQTWKVQKFLFSPDTPAGSALHDKHTVDMMAEAATRESLNSIYSHQQQAVEESYTRPIKSRLGKIRTTTVQAELANTEDSKLPHLTFAMNNNSYHGNNNNNSPTKAAAISSRRPQTTAQNSNNSKSVVFINNNNNNNNSNSKNGSNSKKENPFRLKSEKSCPQLSVTMSSKGAPLTSLYV